MKKYLPHVLIAFFVVSPAYAADKAEAAKSAVPSNEDVRAAACNHMQENVTLSISFNIRAESFGEAKKKYDEKMKQIDDFAKQQSIKKFDMQSMNYNINSQPNYEGGTPEISYQLNGNASYMLDSSDSAFKLGEFLTQKKFQISVGVNKYRNGPCNNNLAD